MFIKIMPTVSLVFYLTSSLVMAKPLGVKGLKQIQSVKLLCKFVKQYIILQCYTVPKHFLCFQSYTCRNTSGSLGELENYKYSSVSTATVFGVRPISTTHCKYERKFSTCISFIK